MNMCRYAICSESTIQNLAKIRPSSKARLINIDGVNQVISFAIYVFIPAVNNIKASYSHFQHSQYKS